MTPLWLHTSDLSSAGYGKVEKRVRTTGGGATGSVRNLRIREDTAKYLLNLDPSSAHYDPKSRSMREDPQPHKAKKAFAGDNFVRKSGDYHAWEAERMHQLEAYDHGATLHMQAAPSQAEILHQNFKVKKDKLQVSCWCCFSSVVSLRGSISRGLWSHSYSLTVYPLRDCLSFAMSHV